MMGDDRPFIKRLMGEQPGGPQAPAETYRMVQDDHNRIDGLESWRDKSATPTINQLIEHANAQSTVINEQTDAIAGLQKWKSDVVEQQFKQNGTAIQNNADGIVKLDDDMKILAGTIRDASKAAESNSRAIQDHSTYHTDKLDPAMSALNSQLAGLDVNLNALRSAHDTILASVTDNKSGINKILSESIPNIQKQVDETSASVSAIAANIDTVFASFAALDARVAVLERRSGVGAPEVRPPEPPSPQPPKAPTVS